VGYGVKSDIFTCGICVDLLPLTKRKEGHMGRRIWTADQKLAIVLQGIKGNTTISELCREQGISQVQYYKWRDMFFEGAKKQLAGKRALNGTPEKAKIKQLERIIGRQTVTIEILKKIQNLEDD